MKGYFLIISLFFYLGTAAQITISTTGAICSTATGSITVTASFGTPPYQYSIDVINFQASNIFSNLYPGTYTITVKDADGNIRIGNGIVTNLAPAITVSSTATSCTNLDGTITVDATGGVVPYQYSVSGRPYQASNVFTGLSGGNYFIYVKDATDCVTQGTIVVQNPYNFFYLSIGTTSPSCDANNGTITATVAGGQAPYRLSLDGINFQSNNIFTGLGPNTYTVYCKDANNCSVAASIGIERITTVTTRISSCGSGATDITVSTCGGVAPYKYSIDGVNFQTSNIFTYLPPGTYTITVKDAVGELKTVTVTLNNVLLQLYAYCSANATCPNSNGAIIGYYSGGTAPYQYSIDGISYQLSNIFSGLAAGSYTMYLKDANGCTASNVVSVGSFSGINISATTTNATCYNNGSITVNTIGGVAPFLYSINGTVYQSDNVFLDLASGNYTVFVKDAIGCISTQAASVYNSSGIYIGLTTSSSSCTIPNGTIQVYASGGISPYQYSLNGTSYQAGNIFAGLAPGSYTIYVKDASGCINANTAIVSNASGLYASATGNNATCGNNGVIYVYGSGGVGTKKYSINGTTYQLSNTFNNLTPGNYTVYVKDANACIATNTISITGEVSTLTLSATATDATCVNNDGSITINPTGGRLPLQYSINNLPYQPTRYFIGLAAGSYTAYVKDANNCSASYPVTVGSTIIQPISGVNIYPNPTSNNQFVLVLGNQLKGSYKVRILNSVGQLVYSSTIENSCTCCTGSYTIKLPTLLSSGVYNVLITLPDNSSKVKKLLVNGK